MKKTFVFAILAMAGLFIAVSFNLQLGGTKTVAVPESMLGNVLYVCPADGGMWQSMANGFGAFSRPILMMFIFAGLVLLAVWGWNLYQNLLNDKFTKKDFSTAWGFTKLYFWAAVIMLLIIMTPNHFRKVQISGVSGDYVLCESTDVSRGARAVRASAVSR